MQLMGATSSPGSDEVEGSEGGEAWAPFISVNHAQEEVSFDTWVKLPRKAQGDLQDLIRRGLAGCDNPEVGSLIAQITKAHVAVQELLLANMDAWGVYLH